MCSRGWKRTLGLAQSAGDGAGAATAGHGNVELVGVLLAPSVLGRATVLKTTDDHSYER